MNQRTADEGKGRVGEGRKVIGALPLARKIHVSSTVVGALPASIASKPSPKALIFAGAKRPAAAAAITTPKAPAFSFAGSTAPLTIAPLKNEPQAAAKGKQTTAEAPSHTIRSAAGEVWQDPTLADWDPNDFRIFVGDLAPEVTDTMLHQAFARFGSISRTRVIREKKSNRSKGFGFVGFKDPQDFLRAMREMNGKYIGSRPVKLKKSNWLDRSADLHPADAAAPAPKRKSK